MKRLVLAVASLLSVFTGNGQTGDNSLLWKISGHGLAKPSYILGTIHIICKDEFVWTPKMNADFVSAEKVCFEMDLDDPSIMMKVAQGLIDKKGKKLQSYFTPEQYTALKKYVKDSLGMDIATFEYMKPVALQTMLMTGSSGCTDPISYEDSLMKAANKRKVEILGLESAEEQLAILDAMPIDSVIKSLVEVAEHRDTGGGINEYKKMLDAYKKQDLAALFTMINESKDLSTSMDAFLFDRNARWIGRMGEKMKQSSIFFAVGAGHLWSDKGVLALLRKEGYTVEAVH